MSVLTLSDVHLTYGTDIILNGTDLAIQPGDRICLSGRNGSGKSTLMNLMLGNVLPDSGNVWRQSGLRFAALEQSLPTREDQTIFASVAAAFAEVGQLLADYDEASVRTNVSLNELDRLQHAIEAVDGWSLKHRIDAVLDRLGMDPLQNVLNLSGGWLKRVAIARSLVLAPDVWFLDEPTNHLDIPTIQWLESVMKDFAGTLIFVSHDRELMQAVATSVIGIDRGRVARWDCDYQTFLQRRDHEREVEAEQNKLFDHKLAQEEVWIRQGIKARRTRNEGRVRALEDLRKERSQRRNERNLQLEIGSASKSGKLVVDATCVNKAYDGKSVVKDFDLIIQRGDRIGLIGPNGAGKSTLIRMLLGEEAPDSGEIKLGTRLDVAYFDQSREQLNPDQSVSDYISHGREFIEIGGKSLHVVSYLGNFMFNGDQARAPIRTLSGGEQNRLLLARLFAEPANFLLLDEPTNDLDIETLELLEERLAEFEGTVLVVSHDRNFLDNVITSLLVFEGDGFIQESVGGYSDWYRGSGGFQSTGDEKPATAPSNGNDFEANKKRKSKKQKVERELIKELSKLPDQVEAVEASIVMLQATMATPGFFDQPANIKQPVMDKLKTAEAKVEMLMSRWETLEATLADPAGNQ
ncbi:MAG: ATP-binding cassette subfamily F protein uup [Candidatus Azotimanducaceae bacterium]